MSCGVGRRHVSDLAWLWLWCRLATVAPTRPLAWEPPYASGAALKKKKKVCMYMYEWVTLLYSRNWQNIINQLHFNNNHLKIAAVVLLLQNPHKESLAV